jgi:hypothetical protein
MRSNSRTKFLQIVVHVSPDYRGSYIVIETLVLLVAVAWFAGMAVQVYRWRQDVLYGPYIRRDVVGGPGHNN